MRATRLLVSLFLGVLACGLVPGDVRAQAPTATIVMTASSTSVPVGGTFRLEINIDATGGEAPDPELPDLSAFEILSRQVFRPMSVRMGWGTSTTVVTSSIRVNFVLRATREGSVALTPATVRMGGRELRSNPLTINVVPAGTAPPTATPGTPLPGTPGTPPGANPPLASPPLGALDGAIFDDQAFLRTVIDRSDPFVGEQVTATIYLYIRGSLTSNPAVAREASTDGFWVRDLFGPTHSFEPTPQVVNGARFLAYPLRRFAAFPLHAGDLEIGAMTLNIPRGSPIDIFMGTPQPDLERTGVPVSIHVRDLPTEGRPAVRTSHVGTLTLEATLDRTQVPTGDAVTLTLVANGTGQIDGLDLGELVVDGVRVLSPQVDGEVSAPGDRVMGTRRIQWLIVPEREGSFVIPAFRVAVFDPGTETWSIAETTPLTLVAAGNPVGTAATPTDEPTPTEVDEPAFELGPVRTESALSRHRERIASSPWFPWAVVAMPLGFLAFVGARTLRGRRGQSEDKGPQRSAKEARKRLDAAAAAAKANDTRGFYAAITLALRSVVEGKLGEAVGSLTHGQLEKRLVERGMKSELAKSVALELESSEYARFSTSGGADGEMEACLGRARNILGELERFVPTPEDE